MENTMWIVIEIIFAFINMILMYLFIRMFLKKKSKTYTIVDILGFISVIAANFLASYFISDNTLVFSVITFLSAFALGAICFRAKLHYIIVAVVFAFLVGISSEMIAVFIITGFQAVSVEDILQLSIYRMQSRVISCLIYLIVIVLVNRFINVRMELMTTRLTLALCVLPLTSVFVIYQFAVHIVVSMYVLTLSETIPLLSIIIINIFIFVLVDNILKQKEKDQALIRIESQNAVYQQQIENFLITHEQIRKITHDFKHQVDSLIILCEEKQCDKLLSCLKNLSSRCHNDLIIKTGNKMLDALLSSKKAEAERQQIYFDLKLDVQPNLPYISLEHCVLLSNGLDNAIEACGRSKGKAKLIDLELTANAIAFMFRLRNTLGEKPEPLGETFKSKKNNKFKHGIGLISMKSTCQELDGKIDYSYDDEYFTVWVYIPI